MNELWPILTPILLVDIINPVLFAFMVYAAGTKNPLANSTSILIGHTTAYFVAGIFLSLGLSKLIHRLENPLFIDYIISIVIGLLLLWVAFQATKTQEKNENKAEGELTLLKAFSLGAIVNFVGIPFALPYFAAIDQILKHQLSVYDSIFLLAFYNFLYAAPFVLIPVLIFIMGKGSLGILKSINQFLDKISRVIMPIMLLLIGLALIADAVKYFATGAGLI